METQIQTSNQSLSTQLSEKVSNVAKVIWHVNQLSSFPLNDFQLETWAKTLDEIYPELDLQKLKSIIDDMKMSKIEWDPRLGIQNLTRQLNYDPNKEFLSRL